MGSEMLFCGACGARIEAGARFCTSCGESQAQFAAPAGTVEHGPASDPIEIAETEILPAPPPAAAPIEPATPQVRSGKAKEVTGGVVLGYVCAVLMPVVGIVVGAVLHRRNSHGIGIVLVSVVTMVLALVVAGIAMSAYLVEAFEI